MLLVANSVELSLTKKILRYYALLERVRKFGSEKLINLSALQVQLPLWSSPRTCSPTLFLEWGGAVEIV